jgi:GNAT superfamily N-acetyltransferase
MAKFDEGHWWLATRRMANGQDELAGFAGMVPSLSTEHALYLNRSGVHPAHRGRGLQRRLLRAREALAKRLGYRALVSDTTDNIHSANNLIAAGFKLFTPERPWFTAHTLYWIKRFT